MSARALKKLNGGGDLQGELRKLGVIGQSDESSEEDEQHIIKPGKAKKKKNKTLVNAYLLLEENEDPEEEPNPSEDENETNTEPQAATSQEKKKRKNKIKKSKPKPQPPVEELSDEFLEEESGSELSRNVKESEGLGQMNLLSVESKNLKPDNEMRRIFGSQVVLADRRRNMRGGSISKTTWLVQPNPHWAHLPKLGLTMQLCDTSDGYMNFNFNHSRDYQKVQLQFLDAVASYNPDNVIALLNANPSHIDSLLQLSDICRMGEDPQTAAELVERALYVLESAFHPSFGLASGLCRLDYRRPENRSFYLALFKQLVSVGQKGCYRTSMELCKVLFNLSPHDDPLGVLLMIDYYALRAGEYCWLLHFYKKYGESRNLSQLPNWAFSTALAMYFLSQEEQEKPVKNDKTKRGKQLEYTVTEEEADKALQDALIMFPGFLKPMIDKCNVQPDESIFRNELFGPMAEYDQSQPLKLLIQLYIARTFTIWKQPIVLPFLERNANAALRRLHTGEQYHKVCVEARKRRYVGTPRNICRHVLLSDFKEATALVPSGVADGVMMYDPLPPKDNISSYSTERSRPAPTAADDANILSVFFRSLMPDYRPSAENRVNLEIDGGENPGNQEGAGANLRRSVATLIDSMRDLLHNMNNPRPEGPNDDAGNQ